MQGLAWDDEGRLWASEFGDSTWDELNLIEKGGNYGWPEVEGTGGGPEFVDPQLVWPVEDASPSGLAYADGHLWMAGPPRPAALAHRASPTTGRAIAARRRSSPRTTAGCGPSSTAPDDQLWLTTSNQDGRGEPDPGRRPDHRHPALTGSTRAGDDARRAARRSVVRIAGPSTTMATPVVIARPVSQPPVEVSSV